MRAQLAVKPPPNDDESVAGYVVHLSEKNAFVSPAWMLELLKERSGRPVASAAEVARDEKLIRALEALAGLPAHSLAGRGFTPRSYSQASRTMPPTWDARPLESYQRHHPMVCPACLDDAPYARKLWDLAHFPVCTRHGLVLVDTCHRCGERLTWRRTRVAHCESCGADLRYSEHIPAAPATLEVADRGLAHIPVGTDAHIELMSPEDLFRLVRLRALMKPGHGLEDAMKENFTKLPLADRLQALSLIADAWNGRFLESARIRQTLLENWRHLKALDANFHIRRELRRWVDTADLEDPVAGMVLHDYPDADADKAYHVYAGNPPRFANAEEVSRFLDVDKPLLECLRWTFLLKHPSPRHLAYDADDVLDCRNFLDDLLTPEEVDQIIGAPGISRMLEKSRLIERWCRPTEKSCFAPASLARLFNEIRMRVGPAPETGATQTMGQLAKGDPDRLMDLIANVFSASLQLVDWVAPYRLVDLVVLEATDPHVSSLQAYSEREQTRGAHDGS